MPTFVAPAAVPEHIYRTAGSSQRAHCSDLSTRAERGFCSRDDFSWMWLRGEISRRWWKFFRAAAMDARSAAIEARRYLAGVVTGDRQPAVRSRQDQQLPAAAACTWIGWSLLFAVSEASSEYA